MRYFLFTISVLFAFHASAEEFSVQRMQDRIESLEKELNMMQQEVYKNGKKAGSSKESSGGGNSAKNDVRINEFDESLRRLNGKLEENENSINKLSEKLDKVLADVDFRINAMEAKAKQQAAVPPPAPTPAPAADTTKDDTADAAAPADNVAIAKTETDKKEPAAKAEAEKADKTDKKDVPQPLDPQGQYDKAFDLLRKSEYDKAEKAFKDFIAANKGSDLLSNAYYWLGETYYVREGYDKSAVSFLKGYQGDPKGNKAADNLFKLAMSLDKLKKKKEACTTIDKLNKEFPKLDAATKEKVTKEKASLKCGS
jgi:tol-pal system protein YbgF